MTDRLHPPASASLDPRWDDRYAEYLIAMDNLCASAELARFRIEVITTGGGTITGLVTPAANPDDSAQLGDSGVPRTLRIDDVQVCLDEIVQLTIHPPAPGVSSPELTAG